MPSANGRGSGRGGIPPPPEEEEDEEDEAVFTPTSAGKKGSGKQEREPKIPMFKGESTAEYRI